MKWHALKTNESQMFYESSQAKGPDGLLRFVIVGQRDQEYLHSP